MTKKQMIEAIQQKEAEAFLQLQKDINLFGDTNSITSCSRSKWATITNLMENLKIKPNNKLPENQVAFTFITDRKKIELPNLN